MLVGYMISHYQAQQTTKLLLLITKAFFLLSTLSKHHCQYPLIPPYEPCIYKLFKNHSNLITFQSLFNVLTPMHVNVFSKLKHIKLIKTHFMTRMYYIPKSIALY